MANYLITKIIQAIHLLLCIAIVTGPFIIKDKYFLKMYVICVTLIVFHWILNNDTCALTIAEEWLTGKPSDQTFIGRIVKPVYNIENIHIVNATIILLIIAIVRLIRCQSIS